MRRLGPHLLSALVIAAASPLLAGCGGSSPAARSSTVALPPIAGRFSYEIGGAYPVPKSATIVDRDHDAAAAAGTYSICYLNAYQAQPEALGWWKSTHPNLLLRDRAGTLVIDAEWNEVLFDISSASRRAELGKVVGGWVDGCAARGYRAVEADNLDSYTRSKALLTAGDALAFGGQLAQRAHHDHLALAQKNAADLSAEARRAGFDFAVAEECQVYTECDSYTAAYGKHLIEIEYTDQPLAAFRTACALRGHAASIVLRDRDVTPATDPRHVERWCPS